MSKNQFLNTIDCITMETFEDIPKSNIIVLTVNKKTRFYNIRALYEWVKINPVEPETRIGFSKHQLKKIKKRHGYSTYQNISQHTSKFINLNLPQTLVMSKIKKENLGKMMDNILEHSKNIDINLTEINNYDLDFKIDDELISNMQQILGSSNIISNNDLKKMLENSLDIMKLNPDVCKHMTDVYTTISQM